jgi:hypothetical protein
MAAEHRVDGIENLVAQCGSDGERLQVHVSPPVGLSFVSPGERAPPRRAFPFVRVERFADAAMLAGHFAQAAAFFNAKATWVPKSAANGPRAGGAGSANSRLS